MNKKSIWSSLWMIGIGLIAQSSHAVLQLTDDSEARETIAGRPVKIEYVRPDSRGVSYGPRTKPNLDQVNCANSQLKVIENILNNPESLLATIFPLNAVGAKSAGYNPILIRVVRPGTFGGGPKEKLPVVGAWSNYSPSSGLGLDKVLGAMIF